MHFHRPAPVPALVLALTVAIVALAPAARAADASPYDWAVAYYMSYDNNLEGCGEPILGMIQEGVSTASTERTIAAVQADFTDAGGMRRVVLSKEGRREMPIATEDSAVEDTAIEYLRWFVKTFKAKRYVFTFLNHGGQLDAMCADEHPATPGKEWMSGRVLGEKLRKLKAEIPGKLELLFLQQCGRGSIENLYSFRGIAEHVMSSPVPVGAPNTYYAEFHRWLAANPEATGDKLAEKIADLDEHYTIYTALRSEALDELPKRLDKALAPFLKREALKPAGRLRVIHPVGEPIVDARAFFDRLATANEIDTKAVDEFFAWTKKDLFTMIRPRGRGAESLCGLSIFAARSPAEGAKYRHLEIYQASKLAKLWAKIDTKTAEAPRQPGERGRRSF